MVCCRSPVRKAASPPSTKWGCLREQREGDMVVLEQDGSEDPWASRKYIPGEPGWVLPVSHLLAQRFAQQCTQHCQTTDCKQLV